ncbi:hypothetical protein INS49_010105 [Diaporthe citri]|uniref:uncharacterized protein n=1 Tax=Diaporthe citri TaxID=83186 RepID=UPI001C80920E|nr:uncharacterized protein INS49_010105 [Diaporthe citri]KAG6361876.1 hypothetical protein INS49_010105 [Diaporthe citri]
MGSAYEDIIGSDVFTFVIGPNGKEYNVHGTAISRLSKPLGVLINGDMCEAKEKCVKWPDIDEKTFVRFAQWAYTETYVTEEPDILLGHSLIESPNAPSMTPALPNRKTSEMPLYSLITANSTQYQKKQYCWNQVCGWPSDVPEMPHKIFDQAIRRVLIHEFLDTSGTTYPTSTSVFSARRNIEGCEDYTGVFLCHAKLYVMADTYDIPSLKQLSLHRLHATLKEFTLYPSRFNDIAALAKYVFENTVPEDKIRDMITLYYACIVEDARKQDSLKSLIEEIPDFASGLINKMGDRLA